MMLALWDLWGHILAVFQEEIMLKEFPDFTSLLSFPKEKAHNMIQQILRTFSCIWSAALSSSFEPLLMDWLRGSHHLCHPEAPGQASSDTPHMSWQALDRDPAPGHDSEACLASGPCRLTSGNPHGNTPTTPSAQPTPWSPGLTIPPPSPALSCNFIS